MKKKTTKLISILLTLVMLLSLLPMTALAAEEEKETIPSISATVTLPTAGAHPVETGTPGDSSYKIMKVRFSEKDPETGIYTSLESTDTFEAGKTYMVNVLFRANSGYKIDRNTVSASINGQNAAWWSTISDGWDSQYYYIEYTVPEDVPATKTPITSVKVSDITEPEIGATPDFDITLTGEGVALYEYDEGEWEAITWDKFDPETGEWEPMDEDTPFGAGLYCLGVALESEARYEFTDATKFYYNDYELPEFDGSYESNYERWDGGVDIFLYFTLEDPAAPTEITSLSATVTEPVAGASPSFEAVAGGEGYTAKLEWEIVAEETIIYPEDDYKFKAAEKYGLWVAFILKDGYEFADDVTITINGITPEDTYEYGDEIVGLVTYTIPAATPITSVEVSDVTAPAYGAAPDFDITVTGTGAVIDEYDPPYWYKYNPSNPASNKWEPVGADATFGEGDYRLEVWLSAEDGYEFTEDTECFFGEDELPDKNNAAEGESCYLFDSDEYVVIYLYFTLEESAAPVETYTVTFVTEHGEAPSQQTITAGAKVSEPAVPTADGWTFNGWFADGSASAWDFETDTVNADITLTASWTENEPEAQTATIVVKKWDSNQQPLAGATFTLTLPGSIQPAYTAVSGEDGLVTFTDVEDGIYTLEETEAPTGYIINDDTWSFVVRNGVVSDVTGTSYDNNNPITVINEIIPAPQTATIVVMKWDSNKQPLAGATFTLTVPGSIEPAYTAVSGADGLVTFTGVADGSYTLAESEAPAGYIKDNATWTFNVRDGVVSDNDGTPYDNSDPLRIANEPALAPELPDIVIWKTDGGQNYIAGATFTLTKERENAPAYTATSDEDGKVLFEGVADGIYILAESEAPAGYIKTDVTYKFLVENGKVSLYEDDDPVAYEDREPITIANLPVPELPDIVVWKTDGGQNYIAGATFTLTKERETSAAYTATSDENGKVLFEDVADGIYILAETAAPEGYIKTDATYKFLVEGGEVSLYEDDDPVAYEDQLSIANEPVVTVTLPITKVVAKGGTVAPGQQTFTFEIKEFGNSNYDVSLATILENTITTNGVGFYEGVLKFTLTGNDAEDILSEGLIIAEKNDGATNWTYDTKEWTVYANNAATSGEQWSFLNDDIAPNGAERATFTNTYTKNASSGGGGGGGSGSSGGSSGSSSSSNKPVLNKEDHMAFLQGYADGTFRPEKNMTRAQVTVMFARLLVEKLEVGKTYSNSFSDVPADYWAANEIGYMEKFGIINGFNDGTFRPNDPVTRAQFAAIACRFEELTEGTKTFSDVPADHWAAKYISCAAERGWVGGFTDGTFRPNNYITRAQVAAVTCRLLERNADEKYIEKHFDDLTYTFSDMTEQHFAYWYALEASNGHDYTKKADKETWSSLLK